MSKSRQHTTIRISLDTDKLLRDYVNTHTTTMTETINTAILRYIERPRIYKQIQITEQYRWKHSRVRVTVYLEDEAKWALARFTRLYRQSTKMRITITEIVSQAIKEYVGGK